MLTKSIRIILFAGCYAVHGMNTPAKPKVERWRKDNVGSVSSQISEKEKATHQIITKMLQEKDQPTFWRNLGSLEPEDRYTVYKAGKAWEKLVINPVFGGQVYTFDASAVRAWLYSIRGDITDGGVIPQWLPEDEIRRVKRQFSVKKAPNKTSSLPKISLPEVEMYSAQSYQQGLLPDVEISRVQGSFLPPVELSYEESN